MRSFLLPLSLLICVPGTLHAQTLWQDATQEALGETAEWSNKVEVADLDGDGDVDLLFANGGGYNQPGPPEANRVFFNDGMGSFTDVTSAVLGDEPDIARVIKARDVNADGFIDIIVGTTYQTQSRLYLGRGAGAFDEVTSTHMPQVDDSIGDLEVGDVDGDGDLDMVLADWGPGDPLTSDGGRVKLYLNDGEGRFTDATDKMPARLVQMSWDLEVFDLDNDLDLDILVSCKICQGNALFLGDGQGGFVDASERVPTFLAEPGFQGMDMNRDGDPETNNYDFEVMDLNQDGFLDVVTINDGDIVDDGGPFHRREHILLGDGEGGLRDATATWLPDAVNTGWDDNTALFLDVDHDGDPDLLFGSLDGPDRLLLNTGKTLVAYEDGPAIDPEVSTPGTLGIAVADLNGDGRLDLVQSQGELADPELVMFGTQALARDARGPAIPLLDVSSDGVVTARVHDNKSSLAAHDIPSVWVVGAGDARVDLSWMGGYLWRARLDGVEALELCAQDAAGNETCEPIGGDSGKLDTRDPGTNQTPSGQAGGCSSTQTPGPTSPGLLVLGLLGWLWRRRERV